MSVLIFFFHQTPNSWASTSNCHDVSSSNVRGLCCGVGGIILFSMLMVSSLVFRHHSCLLDFRQKTPRVFWRKTWVCGSTTSRIRIKQNITVHIHKRERNSHIRHRERPTKHTHTENPKGTTPSPPSSPHPTHTLNLRHETEVLKNFANRPIQTPSFDLAIFPFLPPPLFSHVYFLLV